MLSPTSDMRDKHRGAPTTQYPGSTWRQAGSCVDYKVFVCRLPEFGDFGWQSAVARLMALGHCERTACGVTTVRADWGFFQIPVRGFPELKVTFFMVTRKHRRERLLRALAGALRASYEPI